MDSLKKVILMSIVFVPIWMAVTAARQPQPRRALRGMLKRFFVYCAVYVVTILYILPRL